MAHSPPITVDFYIKLHPDVYRVLRVMAASQGYDNVGEWITVHLEGMVDGGQLWKEINEGETFS